MQRLAILPLVLIFLSVEFQTFVNDEATANVSSYEINHIDNTNRCFGSSLETSEEETNHEKFFYFDLVFIPFLPTQNLPQISLDSIYISSAPILKSKFFYTPDTRGSPIS
ncbi:hypothetical protein P3G55_14805 [Leptospira sp. 96542]|nr:hypothetical protein [Leptospira sp. 96542]